METSYITERKGRFCQIYHSGLKKVIRQLPYTEHNFTMLIRAAHRLGIEEWEKVTGRKIPVNNELPKEVNKSKLDKGVTTMEYTLPTTEEIAQLSLDAVKKNLLSITYKPTERTFVHLMFPREELRSKTSTGKTIVFNASSSFTVQLTEEKKEGNVKLLNNDSYEQFKEACNDFIKQIDFCIKMYGQVQKPVMKWY